jgi:hypothetical protein
MAVLIVLPAFRLIFRDAHEFPDGSEYARNRR